jgi:hypothetical protein
MKNLLLCLLLFAAALTRRVNAFAICSSSSSSSSRSGARKSSLVVSSFHPPTNNVASNNARHATRRKLAKKDNNNDASREIGGRRYTKIEDGSPLGVAIVVLGSLFLLGSDSVDASDPAGDSPIWIVFATASVAAGVSRLVRSRKGE